MLSRVTSIPFMRFLEIVWANVEQQRPAVVTTPSGQRSGHRRGNPCHLCSLSNPTTRIHLNPVTTIRYSLPTHGGVRLNVYDVTGRHRGRADKRRNARWQA